MTTAASPVERSILGVDTAEEVDRWLALLCTELFGAPAEAVRWSAGRVGAVWEVRLAGGEHVVIKARRDAPGLEARLRAAAEVQRQLRARRIPLAEVRLPPRKRDNVLVTFEVPLSAPSSVTPDEQALTEASASQLAALVAAAGPVTPVDALAVPSAWCDSNRASRGRRLWPTPHDPDLFGNSFDGAEASVHAVAGASSGRLAHLWAQAPRVVGHDDWEAQNLRFRDTPTSVVAIYDADSLAAVPEAVIAGTAAAVHLAGSPHGPSADIPAMQRFLATYERARQLAGEVPPARSSSWAAAAWLLAYNARCDQALNRQGPRTFLSACRNDGKRILRL